MRASQVLPLAGAIIPGHWTEPKTTLTGLVSKTPTPQVPIYVRYYGVGSLLKGALFDCKDSGGYRRCLRGQWLLWNVSATSDSFRQPYPRPFS